jgi:flagellin-like hook-associated protein FlgL
VQSNLRSANGTMSETEGAMQDAIDMLRQAQTLATQSIGDSISPDERKALMPEVDRLLDQMVSVGNRQYLNTYLFTGQQAVAPFELTRGGVMYRGDRNAMATIVDTDLSQDAFTVPGMEFFGAVSSEIKGTVDLDPALTSDTRVADLGGATGQGVQLGRVSVAAGAEQAEIDLSQCATVGDVLDRLNAELPGGLRASLGVRGIILTQTRTPPGTVTVSDVGGGRTAVDLGLAGSFAGPTRTGDDLNPRLTLLTKVSSLRAGAGVDLNAGLAIRNGEQTATIKLADAQTIEDVLNHINQADIGVWARISDDGRTLDLLNRMSGTDLAVGEHGGLTATALGLRSLNAGTTLAGLNDGRGVPTAEGADLRITTASGVTIDVDLNGATTMQDVIDRLNSLGGGAITAGFVSQGNGLQITDNTAGGGTLAIAALNSSPALAALGLDVTATGNRLVGHDVNPLRTDSPFTALLELRAGLQDDKRLTLTTAGERIDRVLKKMQEVQGSTASQSKVMADRTERVDTETTATQVLLSDARDVDLTEVAVRFQQLQTALQANLSTAAKVLNLSLLDYLQ